MDRTFFWNFYWYRLKQNFINRNKAYKEFEKNKIDVLYFYAFDLEYWKQTDDDLINLFKKVSFVKLDEHKDLLKTLDPNKKYLIINKKNHAMYYYHYMRKLGFKVYLLK